MAQIPAQRMDQRLMQEGRRTRGTLYFGIGLGLAAGLLIILQAFLLAHIVDDVSFHGWNLAAVMPLLWVMLALFVVRAGFSWASELVAFRASARIKTYLRERLLSHLLNLGPVAVAGERSADIASTMIEGVEALEPYFSRYLPQMALVSLIPLAILVFVFPADWISGLILLIAGPLVPFFMVLVGYKAEAINQRQWRKMLLMSAHFLDMVQGLTTLKIFGRAKDEIEIVARISDDYRRTTMAGLRVAFLTSAVLEFFASVSIALVAVSLGARLLEIPPPGHLLYRLLCPFTGTGVFQPSAWPRHPLSCADERHCRRQTHLRHPRHAAAGTGYADDGVPRHPIRQSLGARPAFLL